MVPLALETSLDIKEVKTLAEIRSCYKVICQLLSKPISEEAFIAQVERQKAAGYHLMYIAEGDEVAALAGFRFHEILGWGKILYIDDLVTDATARNKGYGGRLLDWLLEMAKKEKCDQVHLDSGPQRHEAHRLYMNHGLKIIGYHFALDLTSKPESC